MATVHPAYVRTRTSQSSTSKVPDNHLARRYGRNQALERKLEKIARMQKPPARSVSGQDEVFGLPELHRETRENYSAIPDRPAAGSFLPAADITRALSNTTPQGARLRDVFRRVVSRIQVISGLRSRVNTPSPFNSGVRKDSASVATMHITITRPTEADQDATTKDPMLLCRCIRFRPEWVVDSAGDRYYYWLGCLSLAFIYNLIIVTPRAVFHELDGIYVFYILDYFCDFLYVLDIIINMFCGYLEEGVFVREPRKLIRAYFATKTSKLDIISVIPTDLVFPFTGARAPYPFVRINRVLKFVRFDRFFKRLESRTSYPDLCRMLYLMLTFIAMMHLNACLYYYISDWLGVNSDMWVYPGNADWRVGNNTGDNLSDPFHKKYIWSFFWSMQTLTLIGQIQQPQFEGEFAFVTVNFLVGVVLYANIVGNVSLTIANMNLVMDRFRKNMDAVKQYCILRKIDGELQARIVRYFEYQWMNKQFIDETKALACLPDKFEAELALRVHLDTLKKVNIFHDVEPGLLADLVLKLKFEIYSPGDYICRKGDIGKEMYIVKRGHLEVVADDGRTVFATLGQGSVFGEISILNIVGIRTGNRRTANVRSLGYSDLFVLQKDALWDALREYPEAKKKMLERGKQMLLKDRLLDERAADLAERRQSNFLDKVELVEKNIDEMQTRFGRLVAEQASSLNKMRMRVSRLTELVNLQIQHYK